MKQPPSPGVHQRLLLLLLQEYRLKAFSTLLRMSGPVHRASLAVGCPTVLPDIGPCNVSLRTIMKSSLSWRSRSLRMNIDSINSLPIPTKILRTSLHRPTLPYVITVEDQIGRLLSRSCLTPRRNRSSSFASSGDSTLNRTHSKRVAHLIVVNPALVPLEGCVSVPADTEAVEEPAAVPEDPRVHRMQHREVNTETLFHINS